MQYRIERAARRMGKFALFTLALTSPRRTRFNFYTKASVAILTRRLVELGLKVKAK